MKHLRKQIVTSFNDCQHLISSCPEELKRSISLAGSINYAELKMNDDPMITINIAGASQTDDDKTISTVEGDYWIYETTYIEKQLSCEMGDISSK